MPAKLTPISKGVVHSTPHRTRLRVPRIYRSHDHMQRVQHALEKVPGVKSVHTTVGTGSVLIEHENKPAIVEGIGDALARATPELLEVLLGETEVATAIGGAMTIGALFSKLFAGGENGAEPRIHPETQAKIKRMVPFAFLVVGAWQLIEQESIFGSIAPIALFYWAFDTHWKFREVEPDLEKITRLSANKSR